MSYQFWSSVEMWSLPVIAWVFAVAATLRRRRWQRMLAAIQSAPPGQLPEPPRRIRWTEGMLIMFVLLPLRLVAGRRPLLGLASRRGGLLSAKQVKALEAQCGIMPDPEPDPEPDDDLPAAMGGTVHSGRFPIASADDMRSAHERILDQEPSTPVKALRNMRNDLWQQLKAMADCAALDSRAFTREEAHRWEALNLRMDRLDMRIKIAMEVERGVADAKALIDRAMQRSVADQAAYERGRQAGLDLIRHLDQRLAEQRALCTTDPSTLRNPVEVTTVGSPERYWIEGDPGA